MLSSTRMSSLTLLTLAFPVGTMAPQEALSVHRRLVQRTRSLRSAPGGIGTSFRDLFAGNSAGGGESESLDDRGIGTDHFLLNRSPSLKIIATAVGVAS